MIWNGVGGKSVRQENVSGGHIFLGNSVLPEGYTVHPRTNYPRMFLTSIIKGTDDGLHNTNLRIYTNYNNTKAATRSLFLVDKLVIIIIIMERVFQCYD